MVLDPLEFAPAATPYSRGPRHRRSCRRVGRWMLSAITAGALVLTSAGDGWAAVSRILHLRCTNPVSGASWPVVVDLDRGRVDSLPATITDKSISWHDPKQGFFDLERDTGKLQFRNASSTGGYFLNYTCRSE